MTHDELVERAVRWLRRRRRCPVVFAELATHAGETPDAIGWYEGFSILIECKTSRSDFHRDKKKRHRQAAKVLDFGMGNERFYMAPSDVLSPEDMPEGWGLLEVTRRTVKVSQASIRWSQDALGLRKEVIMLQSAVRRHQVGAFWKADEAKFESYLDHKRRKKDESKDDAQENRSAGDAQGPRDGDEA